MPQGHRPSIMLSPNSSPSKGASNDSPFNSPTFKLDMSIKVDAPVGAMSISPSSRDVVLASRQGLHIIDLDNPYDPPRFLQHLTAWSVADVQWSPHASQPNWVVSTSNQNAIVWNLALPSNRAIEFVLKSHTRAITDINFSAHDPNSLATCSIDSFVHCWDLRAYQRPVISFCDWFAGATQVKWNRRDEHILASSHDKYVYIWDTRMGAKELRKITAHSTKIYGIDWNRTRKTGIVTCALDKSVRFWDYEKTPADDTPERIIHTSFPVWRARHTPFGWGVMTMPQRGDTSLYLWDRRPNIENKDEPVAKFEGHTDHVKEFVWRWRGGQREDTDDREFQLISWGLDQDIRLWDVDKELVAKVGHDPAKKSRFRVTRKGAQYMTFRDEAAIIKQCEAKETSSAKIPKLSLSSDGRITPRSGLRNGESNLGLGLTGAATTGIAQQLSLGQKKNEDRSYEKSLAGTREGGFIRAPRKTRIETNPITWMKGVKIGRKVSENGVDGSRTSAQGMDFGLSWEAPENLGDEISYVGSKFRNVNFEKVNVAARTCTVALTGPWGLGAKWIFIRVNIAFPPDYPSDGHSIPEFQLERTNIIPDESIEVMNAQLCEIAARHVARNRVCLESCLSYLLGERQDAAYLGSDEEEDSSTDDEEIINIGGDDEEGVISPIHRTSQASVPLPKLCGATWTHDGRIICFFPPKEERPKNSLFSSLAVREVERSIRGPGGKLFEGFGRLFLDPVDRRGDTDAGASDSSFSSDSSDGDTAIHHGPTLGWHLRGVSSLAQGFRRGGSTDRSTTQRSTGTGVRTITGPPNGKTLVAIHDMSHMLPAKKVLALDYQIGEGPEVCRYNAGVAERHGFTDLADVWRLVEMVLSNDVPLDIYPNPREDWEERIMVVAKRASLERSRRDSGLGMEFDEDALELPEAEFWGRVKWGGHPLGGSWLIPELFAYFEKRADVQMLAMLSCVLSETADKSGKLIAAKDTQRRDSQTHRSDYYPNVTALLSSTSYTTPFSLSPSPHHTSHYHPTPIPGSYSSSAAAAAPPAFSSDPLTHMSTPPDYGHYSLSSSPERIRSRPHRPSPADSMLNAFATSSAVTWGAITTFASHHRAESTISDHSSIDSSPGPITITMTSPTLFDEESTVPTPLLLPPHTAHINTYADLLYAWSLPIQRLEILKFAPASSTAAPSSPLFSTQAAERAGGLEIAGCCSRCAGVLEVTAGAKGECKRCKRRQATMSCVVCGTVVKGLYGACLKCGHVAHAACHRGWFGGVVEEECPAGCGCVCMWEDVDPLPGLFVDVREYAGPKMKMKADPWGDYMW